MRILSLLVAAAVLAPTPSTAQVFLRSPDYRGAPVTGAEPGIVLPMPGATPEESSAALLWTLRAGMNVAALQCYAFPLINAVDNYNAMLINHADELKPAYAKVQGYFARTVSGAAAANKAFDQFNTRTYNSFSTLYGQTGYCQTAGSIGSDVMFAPRAGGLAEVARLRMQEFRNSLAPATDVMWRTRPMTLPAGRIPDLPNDCFDKKGNVKSKCLRD